MKICFLGSSVTYGSANGGVSFVEYLCEKHGFTYIKEAVSGTTLVDNGEESYVQRLKNRVSKEESFDLFICQLSTNDAAKNLPMGQIAVDENFDTSTVIGAIEYIISYVKRTWNCPVWFYTGTKFENMQYQNMVDVLYELQKKWDIGILDLWNGLDIQIPQYGEYMSDPVHPNGKGYREWWMPFVEKELNRRIS